MDCSGVLVFAVKLLWTLFHQAFATSHPTPILPPTHPLSYTGPKLVRTFKNDLKWPEIKQATNFKLHYNKANGLLSLVLQRIVGLTQAKLTFLKWRFPQSSPGAN